MTTIYYVGLKGDTEHGESAFSDLTGIVWRVKDESHDVDPRIASRMLQHPDVFSDKSPQQRAEIEAARQQLIEQQRAQAAQQQASGGLSALLAALPAGTTIKTPDGTEITIPGAAAASTDPRREAKAARLGNFTDPDVGDSNKADFGAGDAQGGPATGAEPVQETQVASVDTSAVTLAPGRTVAAAPAPAPAPAKSTSKAKAS